VRPETAFFVAVIVALCAVLVASGAVLIVRAAFRGGVALVRQREAFGQSSVRVSRESAVLRDRIERTTMALGQIRNDGMAWDQEMQRLTESLRTQRESIDRMTQGRLASVIRVARMVSKAAQFAFLWR